MVTGVLESIGEGFLDDDVKEIEVAHLHDAEGAAGALAGQDQVHTYLAPEEAPEQRDQPDS